MSDMHSIKGEFNDRFYDNLRFYGPGIYGFLIKAGHKIDTELGIVVPTVKESDAMLETIITGLFEGVADESGFELNVKFINNLTGNNRVWLEKDIRIPYGAIEYGVFNLSTVPQLLQITKIFQGGKEVKRTQ